MAAIGTVNKLTVKPARLMGSASTDVEASVLYYEYGTFTIANAATTGTLITGLTQLVAAIFFPMNAYAITAAPYADLTTIDPVAGITVNNTNPGNAAGGIFAYLLIGRTQNI